MSIFEIVVLALLQGLTEFLPISSSAHLILPSQMFGWQDQGLAFDVAVHVGTLVAVIAYFRNDIKRAIVGWFTTGFSKAPSADGRLGWYVIIATIPAAVAGLVFNDWISANARSLELIAWTTIIFGVLLGIADRRKSYPYNLASMTLWMVIAIGFAQALALIPGTSRSGVTLTMALLLGIARGDAAKFSFLLSIPLILAAGLLKTMELTQALEPVDWQAMVLGAAISAVSAWFCIHYFLVFINKIGLMPFVVYRLALGALLLVFFV